jgi:hypothetical protein
MVRTGTEDGMTIQESKVKQNYLAIVVATIACFLFEAGWYSIFMQPWLNGIGRTHEWLMSTGVNPALQFVVALIAEAVIAASISCLIQNTGEQTWQRGIMVAAMMWLCFVLPVFSTEYVFEVRPWSLLGVNAGFWLLGMILMGAIVGAWKKK